MKGEKVDSCMQRILIIGGGFGGLSVACRLLRSSIAKQIAITIIDPRSASVYTPWLHTAAAGTIGRDTSNVRADFAFDYFAGIRFRHETMQSIDPVARTVTCADGSMIAYDICVLAPGSVANDFGIPGAKQYAKTLKHTGDASMIRSEMARITHAAQESSQRIVVAGAGANGIELAAECAATVRRFERQGKIPRRSIEVVLVDSGTEPLPMLPRLLRNAVHRRLRHLGIILRMQTMLVNVAEHSVGLRHIDHGTPAESVEVIVCNLCITALGVKMPEFIGALSFEKNAQGRILVDDTLRALGYRDIFILGDAAVLRDGVYPDPQTAQAAVQQSGIVARNIVAMIEKKPVIAYQQKKRWDIIIALGERYAIGTAFGVPVLGYTGHIIRLFIDAKYFLGLPHFVSFRLAASKIRSMYR